MIVTLLFIIFFIYASVSFAYAIYTGVRSGEHQRQINEKRQLFYILVIPMIILAAVILYNIHIVEVLFGILLFVVFVIWGVVFGHN